MNDKKIKALIKSGVLENANEGNVGPVSYDLTTVFYVGGGRASSAKLMSGDSALVAAKEIVALPDDLAARVLLRNSRIRRGSAWTRRSTFLGTRSRCSGEFSGELDFRGMGSYTDVYGG